MVDPRLTGGGEPGPPPPAAPPPAPPGVAARDWWAAATLEADPASPGPRWRRALLALVAVVAAAALVVHLLPAPLGGSPDRTSAASTAAVSILLGSPASIDPAHVGDQGSAQFASALYETLTAVDASLEIRPALAASWQVGEGGTRVTFRLRDGLVFSDGTPLTAPDVVHSWRRVFYPPSPSPLASLMADVKGARELLSGQSRDTSTLGVSAPDPATVVVDLVGGGGSLPAIVSSPTFAIVPPSAGDSELAAAPGTLVGSGGYTLAAISPDAWTLTANARYWAGRPAIGTVKALVGLGGGSPVEAFSDGAVDMTPVSFADAGWLGYDRGLGPALRAYRDLSLSYYGFDTRRGPFTDARLRLAFAQAVDWRRLAALTDPNAAVGATSMVPAGMPGVPAGDFLPAFDPAGARQLLAAAGFPGGAGLPPITMLGGPYGAAYDGQVVAMLRTNLGVRVAYSSVDDAAAYQERLASDTPDIWSMSWIADYPSPNDFLGVLLGSGSTANVGGWSSADFDAAIAAATSASDSAGATAAFGQALAVVRDEAPAVPVVDGRSFWLVRDGLLGAGQNGTGILRLAGLAWSGQ